MLRNNFFTAEEVAAIVTDFRTAGLPEHEVAMMEFARKVALDANSILPEDVDSLRSHGYDDEAILNIAVTAAARTFFSKVLDSLGAQPGVELLDCHPAIRQAIGLE